MKIIFVLMAGLLIGAGILYLILMLKAQSMMMLEDESKYNFSETDSLIRERIELMGWKMPATHDLQLTLHKHGYEVDAVTVFEICKPSLSYEILSKDQERIVSSLMPCRISIYQRSDGKVYISRMNSGLMAKPMKGVVPKVMKAATDEVEEIVKPLIK